MFCGLVPRNVVKKMIDVLVTLLVNVLLRIVSPFTLPSTRIVSKWFALRSCIDDVVERHAIDQDAGGRR